MSEPGTLRDAIARAIDEAPGERVPPLEAMPEEFQRKVYERADAVLVVLKAHAVATRDQRVDRAIDAYREATTRMTCWVGHDDGIHEAVAASDAILFGEEA